MRYLTPNRFQMKKLIPVIILPIFISCVSQKKFSALEDQCLLQKDYEEKLDLIIAMKREAAQPTEHAADLKMELSQLKNQIANMKTIEQMAADGHFGAHNLEHLSEELINASRIQAHDEFAKEMERYNCQSAMRASVEIEAISMLIGDKILKSNPEISIAKNKFDMQIRCPKSSLFSAVGTCSKTGNEIIKSIRQVVDIKSGFAIMVKLETTNDGVSELDRKQGNAIISSLSEFDGKNTVKTALQFEPKLSPADDVLIVVKY